MLAGVMPMGSIMWDDDLRRAIEKNGRASVEAAFSRDPRGKAFGTLDAHESQWAIHYVRSGLPPYFFLIAESEQINPPGDEVFAAIADFVRRRSVDAPLQDGSSG